MHAQRATRAPQGPSPRSGIVRQHNEIASGRSVWACLTVSKHENHDNYEIMKMSTHDMNLFADIALHQVHAQTPRLVEIKIYLYSLGHLILIQI